MGVEKGSVIGQVNNNYRYVDKNITETLERLSYYSL